jgi:hypothetical protein
MSKYFKVLILAMLVVGLMAGSAFAAASLNAGNTTLAAEKIPPAADHPATGVNTAYQPAGAVAASTVVRISLTNGTFTAGSTLDICDVAVSKGTGTVLVSPNNGYVDITLTAPLASGTVYTLSSALCVGAPTPLTTVNVPMGSLSGTVLTMTVANKDNAADPNLLATATVVTVANQFSATLLPVTSKLDFADNMETFVTSGTALPYTPTNLKSQAALTLVSNQAINDKVTVAAGGGACARVLAAGDTLRVKITGNLTGIESIKYGTVPQAYTITAADRTNGYATMNLAGTNLLICYNTDAATAKALELTALNTTGTAIVAGTRTAEITLIGGENVAAAYSRALAAAGTTSHIIQLDATQTHIQHIKADAAAGVETYIVVQSKSSVSGANAVRVEILASDGSMVSYDAGTITSGIPKVIKGSDLKAAVQAAGKTVDGAIGFAGILTVNTPSEDIFGYAAYVTPTHTLRVPLE